jgi:hypothetical protein
LTLYYDDITPLLISLHLLLSLHYWRHWWHYWAAIISLHYWLRQPFIDIDDYYYFIDDTPLRHYAAFQIFFTLHWLAIDIITPLLHYWLLHYWLLIDWLLLTLTLLLPLFRHYYWLLTLLPWLLTLPLLTHYAIIDIIIRLLLTLRHMPLLRHAITPLIISYFIFSLHYWLADITLLRH